MPAAPNVSKGQAENSQKYVLNIHIYYFKKSIADYLHNEVAQKYFIDY